MTAPRGRRNGRNGSGGIPPDRFAWLAGGTAATGVTGAVLAWFRYGGTGADPLSAYPAPSWPAWVMVHVAAAPMVVFALGAIWWTHVVARWRRGERRLGGAATAAAYWAAIASGYALYFAGDEAALAAIRAVHAAAGAALAVGFVAHGVRPRLRRSPCAGPRPGVTILPARRQGTSRAERGSE